MDLMHHEDRTIGWIGAALFVALMAGAVFMALNRNPLERIAALENVLAPPITQSPGL